MRPKLSNGLRSLCPNESPPAGRSSATHDELCKVMEQLLVTQKQQAEELRVLLEGARRTEAQLRGEGGRAESPL